MTTHNGHCSDPAWYCLAHGLFQVGFVDLTGLLALENLPSEAVAEAAIAAALVLEHVPQAVAILLRPGALNALVDAALDEAANPASDNSCGESLSCLPHRGLLSNSKWASENATMSVGRPAHQICFASA